MFGCRQIDGKGQPEEIFFRLKEDSILSNVLKNEDVRSMGRKRPAGKKQSAEEIRVVEKPAVSKFEATEAESSAGQSQPETVAPVSSGAGSNSAAAIPSTAGDPAFSPVKETLRDLVYSAKSIVKRNPLNSNRGSMKGTVSEQGGERPLIPQAIIDDGSLEMLLDRDWRTYYSRRLTGKGLEIGPLHRPMVRHEGMDIDYIDRCTVKELREHYPELNDLPLVEPNIIGDAETLSGIKDKTYDFLIAAHVIEHMRNPLSALEQWCRVVKPRGKIYLIVPDKRVTFDRNRVRTNIEHIIMDYRQPSAERDFDHFIDYAVHVQKKDGNDAIVEAERLQKTDYSIHFHVFLPADILRLVQWFSTNIRPVKLVKGPSMSPGSDEFHLLLQVS